MYQKLHAYETQTTQDGQRAMIENNKQSKYYWGLHKLMEENDLWY